jgi:hypothetical protein
VVEPIVLTESNPDGVAQGVRIGKRATSGQGAHEMAVSYFLVPQIKYESDVLAIETATRNLILNISQRFQNKLSLARKGKRVLFRSVQGESPMNDSLTTKRNFNRAPPQQGPSVAIDPIFP